MNSVAQIAEKFKRNPKIGLFFDEPLSARTSFKIGGKAALLAEPSDVQSLAELLTAIKIKAAPHFVLGGGSNVLFSDSGFDGIIVSTKKLCGIEIIESHSGNERIAQDQDCVASKKPAAIRALAGTSMAALVSFAQEKALSGLEEFAGLPGTVGGAAFMNARCFGKEISDTVQKISWLEWSQEEGAFVQREAVFPKEAWAYKKSPFNNSDSSGKSLMSGGGANEKIVTAADFLTVPGKKEEIAQKAAAFIQERKNKGHYKAPCAGSVFKNNRAFGQPTGKIIDELGLKGEKRGGAQIAPFHGNIIINAGGAKASDVLALVELCKTRAKEKFGFDLEEEIVLA